MADRFHVKAIGLFALCACMFLLLSILRALNIVTPDLTPEYLVVTAVGASLLALLVADRFRELRRRRRMRKGLCANCGYDLSATSLRTVCPECGSARSSY